MDRNDKLLLFLIDLATFCGIAFVALKFFEHLFCVEIPFHLFLKLPR